MAKLIKVSDNKAYRVEAIEVSGKKFISIRQLYQTRKAPGKWQIGRAGVSLPIEDAVSERVVKAVRKLATSADTQFKKIEFDNKNE